MSTGYAKLATGCIELATGCIEQQLVHYFSIRLHQTSLYATQLTASTAGLPHFSIRLHQTSLYATQLTASTAGLPRKHVCSRWTPLHIRITVLCSTADSADVKVADPPVVSTADPDFLLLQLLLLLSSTTDQTSHFRKRPVLFPLKRSNKQDSVLRNLIHLTAAQLLMTSRLLKSSIILDDVTTAEYFYC
ncbi:hypothetical protein F511_32802 [Dorcoceras hygrometricum]|uniref:Uncharacterized protein n=1 Tax=Dorcoceras hygrometricum TaxID=472368 RepID=A0A2Z7CCY9_9LAMI|nr:hypothetical protein F511_32802 [Dorcoceras hygrometricum]